MLRLLTTLLLLAAAPAYAAETAAVVSPRVTATLASEVDAVAPGHAFRVALRLRLAPGWHVYWSNPGDSGQPPEIAFTLPAGASAGALQFPAPHRIPYGPLVNFGYEGEAVFTAALEVPAGLPREGSFVVDAAASWLVCEQICIPEEGRFRLELPIAAAPRAAPGMAALFAAAEAAQAQPSPFAARLGFAGATGTLEVSGPGLAPGAVREAFFFPALWGVLDHAAPQPLVLREGALSLTLTRGQGELPATIDGVVTLVDAAGARGAWLVSAPVGPAWTVAESGLPLWQAALLAALAGLILNLMPCVFPVLAMKAVALSRMAGATRANVRGHALAYTAGVVLFFIALGAGLVALRAAGMAVGWGFQFTSPVFVALIAWLMVAVGLNLSGVFAFGGPSAIGAGAAARGGHLGSFATGALAALVATPCTAPFMAAAIGAALAMKAPATLTVFAAMGLGMAAPYALLGLFPGAARLLPRPGAWMERLKQGLAFPMYGAAAWLIWVLAQQVGPDGVLAALAGCVLIGFAAWAAGMAQRAGSTGRRLGGAAAVAATLGALALLPSLTASPPIAATAAAGTEPWSAARAAALRAEGRPVFVNLTAAWCVTCKVNERVALSTEAVRRAFAAANVAYLTGDWTRGEPAITALLRAHGRDGVPLYLFYPADGGAPAVLPQILTEGIVLRAIAAPRG